MLDTLKDILAGIPSEGESETDNEAPQKETEDNQEDETSAESPAGKKQKEESPSSSGDKEEAKAESDNSEDEDKSLPFHKHPRWQKMYEENRKLQEELKQFRQETEEKLSKTQSLAEQYRQEQLPERFVKLYGDNPEAWKLYREEQAEFKREIKEELIREQQALAQAEIQAVQQGESFVKESISELKADGEVFDENELMKFMVDLKEKYGTLPADDDDNIDFRKGLALMREMQQEKAQIQSMKSKARKQLADSTSSSSRGEPEEKEYLTPADLRKMHW